MLDIQVTGARSALEYRRECEVGDFINSGGGVAKNIRSTCTFWENKIFLVIGCGYLSASRVGKCGRLPKLSGMKKIFFLFNAKAIKLRQVLLDDFSRSGYDCYCALPEDDVAFWSGKYPQIHFVPFNNFSGTSVGILDNLKTYFKIKNLIRQIRPDIVFLGNVLVQARL